MKSPLSPPEESNMTAKHKSVGAFPAHADPLVEEIKEILVEGIFTSNWARIETYHAVGKRLLDEKDVSKAVSLVTEAIPQISDRTLQRCVQFVKKYPSLDNLPEGKAISWAKVCNKYLPAPKEGAWSWRIEDSSSINPEFLCPDRAKIDRQVKAMGPKAKEFVGGIEVFHET